MNSLSNLSYLETNLNTIAYSLRGEPRFDLILCIEGWNRFQDKTALLQQVRELLR